MDKKGESIFAVARKTIYWMIAGVTIMVIVLAVAGIMVGYLNGLTFVPEKLDAEVVSIRFLNTPECFAYEDPETGRVYPGIIDLEKFTVERLEESCYKTANTKELNFALKLVAQDLEILTNNYFHNNVAFAFAPEVFVRDSQGNLVRDTLNIEVMRKI